MSHGSIDNELSEPVNARLAEYFATLAYESLPPEVVLALKRLILDTLGTTLAGNTLGVGCREVVKLALSTKGLPESTLLGLGEQVNASMAAFANGAMSHALNYDASGADGAHLGVTAIAAPLAVAELVGGVSGKEFLCGVAASSELTARLASVVASPEKENANVLKGQLLGYFGAAAGAGRIMNLTPRQMHSAFGLALMQSAGTMQVVFEGDAPAKAIYGAFPNQAGVISALLAKQGIGAQIDVFGGRAGFFGMYYGGIRDLGPLSMNLGQQFLISRMRFKPWPTSGVLHPFIEAALKLVSERMLDPGEITRVTVQGGEHIRPFCQPVEERRKPKNAATAANSLYFAVGKVLVNGKVVLCDFTSEGLQDVAVADLAQRIDCSIDAALGRSAVVTITTSKGESRSARIDKPSSMNDEQLVAKFVDCARYAARPLPVQLVDKLIDTVERLEGLSDIRELSGHLNKS